MKRLTRYPIREHVCIAVKFPEGFAARGQDASGWRCAICGSRMEPPDSAKEEKGEILDAIYEAIKA